MPRELADTEVGSGIALIVLNIGADGFFYLPTTEFFRLSR